MRNGIATMKRILPVVASFSLLLACLNASALSGNEWKQLSVFQRNAYIWGVADAWQNLAQMEKSAKDQPQRSSAVLFTNVAGCVSKGMTYGQISAIVEKYMDDHPSEWHYEMASLAWTAVQIACKSSPQ